MSQPSNDLAPLWVVLWVVGAFGCAPGDRKPPATASLSNTANRIATMPAHTNRLSREKSPYLLQHQHNPVDWYPWGEEAFDKARRENKPIFLSIGYSTCHWCHVMERESFEQESVAAALNEHFVSIKVDREERPDVDRIYMTFVQASTGGGGWPLNVFLTPELRPFYGGTYWPPENRYGRPSFLQVVQNVQQAWSTRRDQILSSAEDLHRRLEEVVRRESLSRDLLSTQQIFQAAAELKSNYDPKFGGFGDAPKFPTPSVPRFLLHLSQRYGDSEARDMVLHTCERMAAGGIYDQLGGGFARYSVDAQWLVPHFEKMLYDNAQLLHLYLDAFLASGRQSFAATARDILRYIERDMTSPEGGFYSAEDADSEGHEGKFYAWTREEMARLLTPEELSVALRYFGVTESGNFEDHSHPQPLKNQNVLSIVDPQLDDTQKAALQRAKEKMMAARDRRVRPHRDDKILASWNGLMLGAVARAGVILDEPKHLAAAEKNLAFLQHRLWDRATRTLYHRWRDGQRDAAQLLEAYAFLLSGVLDLYEATLTPAHLEFALALADAMITKFYDAENGGFWQSTPEAKDLILRVKEDLDGAEPSGNSVAILSLLRLAAITDRHDLRAAAEKSLRLFADRVQRMPQGLPYMLLGLDFSLSEPMRLVLAGDPTAPGARELLRAAHSVFQRHRVILGNAGPVEAFARSLPVKEGKPTAYLCTGQSCRPPTHDPEKVRELLR